MFDNNLQEGEIYGKVKVIEIIIFYDLMYKRLCGFKLY